MLLNSIIYIYFLLFQTTVFDRRQDPEMAPRTSFLFYHSTRFMEDEKPAAHSGIFYFPFAKVESFLYPYVEFLEPSLVMTFFCRTLGARILFLFHCVGLYHKYLFVFSSSILTLSNVK